MDIMCRIGFYPNDYIDKDSKLDEIGLPLPPIPNR
jgi:hypothetical protein